MYQNVITEDMQCFAIKDKEMSMLNSVKLPLISRLWSQRQSRNQKVSPLTHTQSCPPIRALI